MSASTEAAIVVLITAANREEASELAEALVAKRLAACVQVMREMESVFRWQGRVEHATEILLMAKTMQSKFAELEQEVIALHSYETPEIVALPIIAGSRPYLDWLKTSVLEDS